MQIRSLLSLITALVLSPSHGFATSPLPEISVTGGFYIQIAPTANYASGSNCSQTTCSGSNRFTYASLASFSGDGSEQLYAEDCANIFGPQPRIRFQGGASGSATSVLSPNLQRVTALFNVSGGISITPVGNIGLLRGTGGQSIVASVGGTMTLTEPLELDSNRLFVTTLLSFQNAFGTTDAFYGAGSSASVAMTYADNVVASRTFVTGGPNNVHTVDWRVFPPGRYFVSGSINAAAKSNPCIASVFGTRTQAALSVDFLRPTSRTLNLCNDDWCVDPDGDGATTIADLQLVATTGADCNGDGVANNDPFGDDAAFLANALLAQDPSLSDCDNSGFPDSYEIARDPTLDADHNNIIDACELFSFAPDLNSSGSLDRDDVLIALYRVEQPDPGFDLNADATIDTFDLIEYLKAYDALTDDANSD